MTSTVQGPATKLIDDCFAAKLVACEAWDRALGVSEDHACSTVRTLRRCYAMRRPLFEMVDDTFAVATKVWEPFFRAVFPSEGQRAIKHVTASCFGEHKVIEAEFRP